MSRKKKKMVNGLLYQGLTMAFCWCHVNGSNTLLVKLCCKLRTALHHHHGKLGMTEECSNVQRSVWCAKDIEPSNCFFFETKSHCVAEWAFLLSFRSIVLESLCSCLDQDSYLSYSTNMKKFSKIISWHNISPTPQPLSNPPSPYALAQTCPQVQF
jgi:hypothetical protein